MLTNEPAGAGDGLARRASQPTRSASSRKAVQAVRIALMSQWALTFDMSGGPPLAGARPLDGIRRDFPPSSNGVEAPRLSCDLQSETEKGKPMYEITRGAIVRVGVDLAKRVIQVHAVDAAGRRVVGRALKREQFMAWCVQLPAGCLVAMEACSSAHHWALRGARLLGADDRPPSCRFDGRKASKQA